MLTKDELLFLAEAADTYHNTNVDEWVIPSCPIPKEAREVLSYIVTLPKKTLREYG